MTSKTFRITYIDPNTQETVVTKAALEDTGMITAREWAERYALALSEKHTIEEIGTTQT